MFSEDGKPVLGNDEVLLGILLPFSEEVKYNFRIQLLLYPGTHRPPFK